MDVSELIGFSSWMYSSYLLYNIFKNYMKSPLNDFFYYDEEIDRFVIGLFLIGHILVGIHHAIPVILFSIIEIYLFLLLYSILRFIKKKTKMFIIIYNIFYYNCIYSCTFFLDIKVLFRITK